MTLRSRFQALFCSIAFLAVISPVLSQNPADTSASARKLLEQGKFAEAIPLLLELRKAAPGNTNLQMNLANAFAAIGDFSAAAREFEDIHRRLPAFKPATMALASSYLNLGRAREAITLLREQVERDPKAIDSRITLAGVYRGTGDLARSYEQYAAIAALAPDEPQGWYALHQVLRAIADESMEQVELADPESGYMVALAGFKRLEAGQTESAFYLMREALRRTSSLPGAHAALARIYRDRNREDWAAIEDTREKALPKPDCSIDPAACAFLEGKWETVMELTRFARLPQDLFLRQRAATQLAEDAFSKLQGLPASVQSHGAQAERFRSLDRHAEAVAEWRKAIALSKNNLGLQKELAVSLYQARDYAGCAKLTGQLLQQAPEDGDLQMLRGDAALNLQDPATALPFFEKVVAARPAMLPAHASLGRALLLLNRPKEALPHLERALPMDRDGAILYQLAQAYQKTGMDAQAKQALARYQQFIQREQAEKIAMEEKFQITAP